MIILLRLVFRLSSREPWNSVKAYQGFFMRLIKAFLKTPGLLILKCSTQCWAGRLWHRSKRITLLTECRCWIILIVIVSRVPTSGSIICVPGISKLIFCLHWRHFGWISELNSPRVKLVVAKSGSWEIAGQSHSGWWDRSLKILWPSERQWIWLPWRLLFLKASSPARCTLLGTNIFFSSLVALSTHDSPWWKFDASAVLPPLWGSKLPVILLGCSPENGLAWDIYILDILMF